MKITFVAAAADMTGGARVVAIYAKALVQMGHTVCIVLPRPPAIPLRRKVASFLRGKGWPSIDGRPVSHLLDPEIDCHFLDKWRPVTDADVPDADVVVATWWETAEWVNRFSATKGAKVYFVQHHEVFPYLPVERCRATYRLPLHKIVVAKWLQSLMRAEYGDHVVDLVPNSVDRTLFFAPPREKQGTPTAGFIYATTPFKGVDVTCAAIRIIRAKLPNLRIISFGNCQPTRGLPLPEGTEFYFNPPQQQLRELYAQSDVWVTASRSEGFNLPAMEAMTCRTPIVATRTGWPEEAVKTGLNGVLVDVDDVAGVADGAHWVLTRTAAQWRELSHGAHATGSIGSWQESAAMFESALGHARERASRGEIAGGSR